MITQTITLTPVSPGVTKYIQAIQGENKARTLEFLILDTSGQPLDLTGCTVAFYVDRRENGVVQVSATITEDNTAKLSLPSGTCDVPGEWGCWVQVIKPDIFDLRVDNLIIRVQPCDIDDAGEASEEFGLLTQLITQAQQAIENANEAAEEASTTAAETATNVVIQQKAQPNGIATLDSNGKLVQKPTPSDIGAASISEINGINSQINANSLSSGSLIKWDGEKLVNSEPKTDYARLGDVYPVGSVYTSVNNVNPSSLFGGTWVSFASGRTLIGVDTAQTEFNTVQKTGGEKTHTLTTTEIPSHTHMMIGTRSIPEDSSGPFKTPWSDGNPINLRSTGSTGGGQAHNNLPPYITVYFWLRTA